MAWWLIVVLLAVVVAANWRRRWRARRWLRALGRMSPAQANRADSRQSEPYIPRGLLLQWHVTERCNLRCAHCYQEAYSGEELRFQDLLNVLEIDRQPVSWRDIA